MRTRLRTIFPLSVLAGAGACSPTPDVSAELERYGDHANSILALSCECPEDVGYTSVSECYDAIGIVGEDERACLADEAKGQEEMVSDYLECVLPALQTYEDCLLANDACGEGVYELCVMSYESAEAMCPGGQVADLAECVGL